MSSPRLRSLGVNLAIAAAFLILPLLLYAGVTIGPHTIVPADNLFQWPPWQAAAADLSAAAPHNLLISDLIIQNYAWKQFILDSLRDGEIPLWNPYLFAGAPFLANGQHSALYPFSLLFLVLPLSKAYGWFALSQLWLAGVFMYGFGRVLNMRRGSAAVAGLVYQGGSFLVISAAVFPMISAAVVWLPLLLACIERIITTASGPPGERHKSVLWLALGVLALGAQVLAGHAEFTYYTLLIMGLFALWRLVWVGWDAYVNRGDAAVEPGAGLGWTGAFLRPAGWLLALVALGLMLAAVQLTPLLEVGQVNFRVSSASFDEVLGWAYPWRNATGFLLPNFYGNPTHHAFRDVFTGQAVPFELNYHGNLNPHGPYTSFWGLKNYVEAATYLGILPLVLSLLAVVALFRWRVVARLRRLQTLFFLFLGIISLAFIFGTPLYAILYYGLPFIDQLHTPFRWVFPLALVVAALAGFGADAVSDARRANGEQRAALSGRVVSVTGWAALVGGGLVLAGLLLSRLAYGSLEPTVERLLLGLALAADAFPNAQAFYSYQSWQLLALGVALLASGFVLLQSRRTRWWVGLAWAVILLDLVWAGAGFNAAVNPQLLDHRPQAISFLLDQPGQWRLTTYDPRGSGTLNANTPWLHGLQDIRGYDSIIPRQYTDYMAAIEPQNGLQFNRIQPISDPAALNSPLLDVLGVKYVVTTEAIDLPKFSEVWQGERARIYENLAVAPRAYTLPGSAAAVVDDPLAALAELDPRQYVVIDRAEWPDAAAPEDPQAGELRPATVDRYRNNEVVVTAALDEPGWLILNDSYFPGWRAFARPAGSGEDAEQELAITRANGNFRAVELQPGEWTVRFRYSPRSFQLGGLMSFMAVIVLLFMLSVWAWRRYYRPESMTTSGRSVAKNSAAPMAMNLFNKGIDFVFAAFYLRVLGPADAGSFATAIAVAGIFEILANFGLNILLVREVSQDRSRAGSYLLNTSILRVATAIVASLPVFVYLWSTSNSVNPLSQAELVAIVLMMIGMVFSGLALGVSGLFYVHEEAEVPAAVATVTTILKVGFGVAVLLAGFSFVGLAGVSIVVNLITLAILLVLALRRFDLGEPARFDPGLQRSMLRLGFPLMLIHLLQTIFISVDVLLLRQMLPNGEEVVGWYNSAYKWFNALQIIPSYFTLALFPIITRAIATNMDSARRMYQMSVKLMLLLALPIAATMTFSAYFLIGVLGGREFLPHGAIALQIIIWAIPFGWMNSVTNYVLIALGLERAQPPAFALAVGFNVVTNILFIPRYSYVAASVTTILSEIVLLFIFAYFLRRKMTGVSWPGILARPLLLTVVMIGAMLLANQVHWTLAVVVGVAVYAGGLFALRIIGPDEREALAGILPGSISRRLGWLAG